MPFSSYTLLVNLALKNNSEAGRQRNHFKRETHRFHGYMGREGASRGIAEAHSAV